MDFQRVVDAFNEYGSIQTVANLLGISVVTVRRVLITEGQWSSPSSRSIGALHEQGLSTAEIAEQLHMTEKNVQAYLPYTRGSYHTLDKTASSKSSKLYRDRRQNNLQKQARRRTNLFSTAENNHQTEEAAMEVSSNYECKTIHLHLELVLDDCPPEDLNALKSLAKAEKCISRDFLVPSSMTLHALHFAIQRAFGWQNSHLHHFLLPEDIFQALCQSSFHKWGKLCGVYFRFPSEEFEDLYWDDDYDGSVSINTWMKRKYCGPYTYGGHSELYMDCQRNLNDLYSHLPKVEIRVPFEEFMRNPNGKMIQKIISPKEATIDEMRRSVDFGPDLAELLERLTLSELMILDGNEAEIDASTTINLCQPVTKELLYEYDYGDGWQVRITLVETSSEDSLHPEVAETECPICIKRDGLNVMDDVGGVSGYIDFLQTISGNNESERADLRDWARMQGWNGRKPNAKTIL